MIRKKGIRCYIIGNDNLVIQCAEILLSKGHRILGIISSLFAIQNWATQNNIPSSPSFLKFSSSSPLECDYIFSIVNDEILPKSFLKFPKYFCINYHDSLLPHYAGVYATSWAILNQEKYHGITWHIMEEGLDTGDILKQKKVNIEKKETALSLNLKCYAAAIEAFSELIDELATSTYEKIPQDLHQRTYFGLHKKPMGNGLVNWNTPAKTIESLFRACQLGDNYKNGFSQLKLVIDQEFYIITGLKL